MSLRPFGFREGDHLSKGKCIDMGNPHTSAVDMLLVLGHSLMEPQSHLRRADEAPKKKGVELEAHALARIGRQQERVITARRRYYR